MEVNRTVSKTAWSQTPLLLAIASILAIASNEMTVPISATEAGIQGTGDVPLNGEYIKEWLVLGPFFADDARTDLLAHVGGEANVRPEDGDTITTSAGEILGWKRYRSREDIIDLLDALGNYEYATAYAFCVLQSETAGYAKVYLGSDDGVAVWINGGQVHFFPGRRFLRLDEEVFAVDLKAGANPCLVKVSQGTEAWSFAVRVELPSPDCAAVPGTSTDEPSHPIHDASVRTEQSGEETAQTHRDSSPENLINIDAKDSDIRDILVELASVNDINLIMDNSVQGRISMSLNNVSPIEAIELILHGNGFATERIGDSLVAASTEELKKLVPTASEIIVLQHASAPDLKQVLSRIAVGQVGQASLPVDIQADVRTNSLIITGTASSIRKLEQITELMDVAAPPEPQKPTVIKVFPLRNAQATVLQALVSELCSPVGKVHVDDRTNSLIVTDEIAIIQRLAEAIDQLDIQSPYTGKEVAADLYTQVFRLSHIDANVLKDALQDMLSPDGKIQTCVRQKESIIPVQPEDIRVFAEDRRLTASGTRDLIGKKWSDVLIVTDTASVIERIGDLISRLDIKAHQVMIEARLVEVRLSDMESLGISWQGTHSPSGSALRTEFPTDDVNGVTLRIGRLSTRHFEDIMFKLQALEARGQARLISRPSVITLDNELAQMIVADRIPIPRIYETEFRATTTYEFINVGIVLTVIPHITEDGYVLMDAMPEVNSIKEWTIGENPQPIISSRVAHTRVRIEDGQTFVIGGLIKDEQAETVSRVPLLGRIPLLGRLFTAKDTENMRTDLIVFITPRICKERP